MNISLNYLWLKKVAGKSEDAMQFLSILCIPGIVFSRFSRSFVSLILKVLFNILYGSFGCLPRTTQGLKNSKNDYDPLRIKSS